MTGTNVGCLVLAAGSSKRFGSDKRLSGFGDKFLLQHVLANIPDGFCEKLVVLSDGDKSLSSLIGDDWQIVYAPESGKGMGYSLAAGLSVARDWDAALVALADMPWVTAESYTAIRQQLGPDNLVVPQYKGKRGNPVGIGRQYFDRLSKAQGDQGARALFRDDSVNLKTLAVDDPGILQDIDTPQDL